MTDLSAGFDIGTDRPGDLRACEAAALINRSPAQKYPTWSSKGSKDDRSAGRCGADLCMFVKGSIGRQATAMPCRGSDMSVLVR
jgi:hypothetical protein